MTRCAVLLRAVNVGGRNKIAMADLRTLLAAAGCTDVRTYLQSGNAAVSSPMGPEALAGAVRERLVADHGVSVDVLVRTAQEIDEVVAGNPFEVDDPRLLHAVFLVSDADAPAAEQVSPDRVAAGPRVLYVRYAERSQDTPAATWLGRAKLPVGTARNWRTVLALQDLLASGA